MTEQGKPTMVQTAGTTRPPSAATLDKHVRQVLIRSVDGSLNPGCLEKNGNAAWSCVEYDGTGLWCEACSHLARAAAGQLSDFDGPRPGDMVETRRGQR